MTRTLAILAALAFSFVQTASAAEDVPATESAYLLTKIRVNNVDKSLAFYRDFLGYKEVRRVSNDKTGLVEVVISPAGKELESGLVLYYAPAEKWQQHETNAMKNLMISVRNADALNKKLEAAGYKLKSSREMKVDRAYASSVVITYVTDPDGHLIEMVEWKK